MPIRFRCSYCNRLLGIATRKAGMETICPHCGYTITVPVPQDEDGRTERMNFDDVEAMLGRAATEIVPPPGAVAAPAPPAPPPPAPPTEAPRPEVSIPPDWPQPIPKVRPVPPAVPKPPAKPASANPDERPLFERDMDEILGRTVAPAEPDRPKAPKVSGMDAMSLGEPSKQIVLSAQKATGLLVLAVVLIVLAFVTGYFVAPRG